MEQRLCLSTVSPIRQKSDGIGIADWLASLVPAVPVHVSAAVSPCGRGADRDLAPRPQRIGGAGLTSATSGVGHLQTKSRTASAGEMTEALQNQTSNGSPTSALPSIGPAYAPSAKIIFSREKFDGTVGSNHPLDFAALVHVEPPPKTPSNICRPVSF